VRRKINEIYGKSDSYCSIDYNNFIMKILICTAFFYLAGQMMSNFHTICIVKLTKVSIFLNFSFDYTRFLKKN